MPTTMLSSHAGFIIGRNYSGRSTWPDPIKVCQSVLTWQTDVLNLQVFVGSRARVTKQTVGRQDATLDLTLTPIETSRNVTHVPTKTTELTYFF